MTQDERINNNAIRSLDTRLGHFEVLISKIEITTTAKLVKLEKLEKDLNNAYKELSEIKKEQASQPLSRIKDIELFSKNINKKIDVNLDFIVNIEKELNKKIDETAEKTETNLNKNIISKLAIAGALAGVIMALVSVIYYDARADISEIKSEISKLTE